MRQNNTKRSNNRGSSPSGGSRSGGSRGDSSRSGGGTWKGNSRSDSRGGSSWNKSSDSRSGGSRSDSSSRSEGRAWDGGSRNDSRGSSRPSSPRSDNFRSDSSRGGSSRGGSSWDKPRDNRSNEGRRDSRSDSSRGGASWDKPSDSRPSNRPSAGSRSADRPSSSRSELRGGRPGSRSSSPRSESRGGRPSSRPGSAPKSGAPRGVTHDYRGYMPELRTPQRATPMRKRVSNLKGGAKKEYGRIDDNHRAQDIQKQNLFKSNAGTRLNKYIAESGVCSRRKADELIEDGVVKVNRKIVKELGFQVMHGDFVTVKGDPIYPQRHNIYILLNKPKDVITTTNDEYDRRTILDIVKKRSRIFPVGRLDRNTTGAILLTNDGELANRLTHPKYHVRRTYNVKLDYDLTRETAQAIAEGVMVDGQLTAPCELVVSPSGFDKCAITLIEGRNHEVKKMFEAVGYTVRQLDRKVFADISTAGLNRGRYRHLTYEEVRELKKMTGMY